MSDIDVIIKKCYFLGYKKAQEEANVSINKKESGDADEINILRRGWPDPLKRAEKLHEKMTKKDKVNPDSVKERTKMTANSPEISE